ncbi:MAG TPA: sugar isomerase domain-containing protein [Candidatus Dormibacteraeota bacterium]|nr:sugar isomerase domain-containing protein [Candidatus Dormibacteraeota bacterium]
MPNPVSWIDAGIVLLQRVRDTQADAIERASAMCAKAIGDGGLVHTFGSGHSRIPVEEMFPRYGSYPGFHPIVELSMTFHTQVVGANGQRQAMFIERTLGLAEVILANFHFGASDAMIVFSASGLGAVAVEMARGARRQRLPVIAVTSVAQSKAGQVEEGVGARLMDEADIVIDLCTPAGDALCRLDGLPETPIGPSSTLAAVAVADSIKVRTAELLLAKGKLPPVITSAAEVGKRRSDELFEAAYREHARRAARSLAT